MPRRLAVGAAAAFAILLPASVGAQEPVGAALYGERCAVCHQPEGEGVPSSFPPIAGTLGHLLAVDGGRAYLIDTLLFGLAGTITVGGERYVGNMQVLPPLSDAETAAVLNHLLTAMNAASLPADFATYTAAEIAARRTPPRAPTAVTHERERLAAALAAHGLAR